MWVPNGCPHEPGLPVVVEYVGGQASRFGGLDAGLLEHRTNHGGAVGLVLGERLAGPVPRDQDAAAAQLPGARSCAFDGHIPGIIPGPGSFGVTP